MSNAEAKPDDRLIRLPDVLAALGVSRPTLYRLVKAGTFPKPLKQGCTSTWRNSQVQTYIQELV